MSTKLNAMEMAEKRWPQQGFDNAQAAFINAEGAEFAIRISRQVGYSAAIREVAQPIADQRDELLQIVMDIMATPVPDSSYHWLSDNGFTDKINAIVDKCTPKP